ncbi:RNA polymerase sigma-70 factor [Flammeovirgaceae bacterium SG7u.111]|nr:RNA polymerase sigma-70 factor [Flammeovirgaceae bacterium SG7u.132]WPO33246.1 RNA polymerase sigma-70 factor [Flammeovirgaceae bacterium SG7u.111]
MATKEAVLIELIKEGDHEAFNKFYCKYKSPLYRFCLSLLKDKGEVDQIVQDIFISVWTKREGLDSSQNISSYLFTIAKNKIFNHFRNIKRSESKRVDLWSMIEELQVLETENIAETEIEYQLLQKAIEDLPPQRKSVFEKSISEGKSYKEIADELQISPNTVRNHLAKARLELKQFLKLSMEINAVLFLFFL